MRESEFFTLTLARVVQLAKMFQLGLIKDYIEKGGEREGGEKNRNKKLRHL